MAYTRKVTALWAGVMALDMAVCLVAAVQPNLEIWLILCFPVSYMLIGFTFAGEYVYRKAKFGQFDDNLLHDRILKKLLKRKPYRWITIFYWSAGTWGIFLLCMGIFMIISPVVYLLLKAGGGCDTRSYFQLISHKFNRWYTSMMVQIVPGGKFIFLPSNTPVELKHPAIFISNHLSIIDVPLILTKLKRCSIVGKKTMKFIPMFGLTMYMSGMIFVDRKKKFESLSVFESIKERLRRGEVILTFPQGSRSVKWSKKSVKRGWFKIALEEKVPIYPIAIIDTNYILRKGEIIFYFRPRLRAIVQFLEPIHPSGDPSRVEDVTALRDRVVEAIQSAVDSQTDLTRNLWNG